MKPFVADQMWLDLTLQGAPGCFNRNSREGALMSRVEPDTPVERSEGVVR
jgi:hypothetical protein